MNLPVHSEIRSAILDCSLKLFLAIIVTHLEQDTTFQMALLRSLPLILLLVATYDTLSDARVARKNLALNLGGNGGLGLG